MIFLNFSKVAVGLLTLVALVPLKSFAIGCIGEWPNQICPENPPSSRLTETKKLVCFGYNLRGDVGPESISVIIEKQSEEAAHSNAVLVSVLSNIAY